MQRASEEKFFNITIDESINKGMDIGVIAGAGVGGFGGVAGGGYVGFALGGGTPLSIPLAVVGGAIGGIFGYLGGAVTGVVVGGVCGLVIGSCAELSNWIYAWLISKSNAAQQAQVNLQNATQLRQQVQQLNQEMNDLKERTRIQLEEKEQLITNEQKSRAECTKKLAMANKEHDNLNERNEDLMGHRNQAMELYEKKKNQFDKLFNQHELLKKKFSNNNSLVRNEDESFIIKSVSFFSEMLARIKLIMNDPDGSVKVTTLLSLLTLIENGLKNIFHVNSAEEWDSKITAINERTGNNTNELDSIQNELRSLFREMKKLEMELSGAENSGNENISINNNFSISRNPGTFFNSSSEIKTNNTTRPENRPW